MAFAQHIISFKTIFIEFQHSTTVLLQRVEFY